VPKRTSGLSASASSPSTQKSVPEGLSAWKFCSLEGGNRACLFIRGQITVAESDRGVRDRRSNGCQSPACGRDPKPADRRVSNKNLGADVGLSTYSRPGLPSGPVITHCG